MNTWQTLALGLIQGMTELFPISSLGHAVVIPALLNWSVRQSSPAFLPYLVLLHLGTASALLILYRQEWRALSTGFVTASLRGRISHAAERRAFLLIAATVPVGAIALIFEHPIRSLFSSPRLAAGFLIANGVLLAGADVLRRNSTLAHSPTHHFIANLAISNFGKTPDPRRGRTIDDLSLGAAVAIGVAQALAFFPGISRSGVTIGGGLLVGLDHEEAAHFSFLLATPIIGLAGLAEIPELFKPGLPIAVFLGGAVIAGVAAYGSARFLLRYFERGDLGPYAGYCVAAGLGSLILLR